MGSIIAILPDHLLNNEHEVLLTLFESGLDDLYFRREMTREEILYVYEHIPPHFHNRLILPLVAAQWRHETGFKRYHVKEKQRSEEGLYFEKEEIDDYRFSTAIHCYSAMKTLNDRYEMILVSPLFNSMSKSGYTAMAASERMKFENSSDSIRKIGLGGINLERIIQFPEIVQSFDGIALMSGLWQVENIHATFLRIRKLWKGI